MEIRNLGDHSLLYAGDKLLVVLGQPTMTSEPDGDGFRVTIKYPMFWSEQFGERKGEMRLERPATEEETSL